MSLSDFWLSFRHHKTAVAGLALLLCLIVLALLAPLIAPYGYDEQNLSHRLQRPNRFHLMGTDNLGRDITSRLLYGSRVSLRVGLIATGIGILGGGILGAIAGFYGGRFDNIIMRLADIFIAIPTTLLAIAVCAALGSGINQTMFAVGLASIPGYARILRSTVLTVKQEEFIEAARAIGANDKRIILRHILPNALAPLIVQSSLGVAQAILTAASMSFIGLGIRPPNPEWGAMLSAGRGFMRDYPHMVFFPGLAIMVTIFALNLFGDGLRDALDPKLKR